MNERITVRLPEEIIQKMDEIIKREGYRNRSDFLRALIISATTRQKADGTATNLVPERNSRKLEIEISDELYTRLLDLHSRGLFHTPIEGTLSNIVEQLVREYIEKMDKKTLEQKVVI
ncbi:MAG: ribbon-helix-helix domain-containing protein [Thermoplasmata archaeon]